MNLEKTQGGDGMDRYEVIIVGAGPAGLSAAIEAASYGLKVAVFDENDRPGGQLFKQIHKFFGSEEHKAKERGFRIGEQLLSEAEEKGVEVVLNSVVMGIFGNREVSVWKEGKVEHYRANAIVIATGASENAIAFPGWTLPGVMGAGAAQTMMNIHGIKPGNRILMIGSGNVGVVVGYQLIQAGCKLEAVIDASPRVTGYGVHASKIARTGVPFYLGHTIVKAMGDKCVEGAVIAAVDSKWQVVADSEKEFSVDAICLAVGLSPMAQLAEMAGCKMEDDPKKGGLVPVCKESRETSIEGVYAAGDAAGIEEASSAMIQGKIAGLSIAHKQNYIGEENYEQSFKSHRTSLLQLREGMFSPEKKGSLDVKETDEGCPLCESLLGRGYLSDNALEHYPGTPTEERRKKGVVPIIECTQNIPCDPCKDVCPKGCITMSESIAGLPVFEEKDMCTGCGICLSACPGQAIFLVDETYSAEKASVTIPYEMKPLPDIGSKGKIYDRSGALLGDGEVISVKSSPSMDQTVLLTFSVPKKWAMKARYFKEAS